jgi:hypothetical protein
MRQSRGGCLVAAYATLAMVAAVAAGRFTLGTALSPELIARRIFALVPLALFTPMIRFLGFSAKWVAFALAVESTDPVTGEGGKRWRLVHNCRR